MSPFSTNFNVDTVSGFCFLLHIMPSTPYAWEGDLTTVMSNVPLYEGNEHSQ